MNKKRLLILIIGVFLLTGCVKYDLNMGVTSDKSFTITVIDAIQNEYKESYDFNSKKKSYEDLGYKVEQYSDSTHSGVKLTKKFASIDEISSNDCETFELTSLIEPDFNTIKLFKSNKIGTTTTYIANFTYNLSTKDASNLEGEEYDELSNSMSFTYTIKLPENALVVSTNADSKSNNEHTLNWNIKYGTQKNIKFVFNIDDNNVTEPVIDNDVNNNDNSIDIDNNDDIVDKNNNIDNQEDIGKQQTTPIDKEIDIVSVVSSLLVIALIIAIVIYKFKAKKASATPNMKMIHTNPPKRN